MSQFLVDWQGFTLKEQIGQMVVVRASGYLFDWQIRYPAWEAPAAKLKQWLAQLNLGGVILLGGSAPELAWRSQQLQSWAKTPLLIAADIEEGVGHRFAGATWFPPPMALGAIAAKNSTLAQEYATRMGAVTAREALAIGINWLLAPVVDVNNNRANPVINIRAFGERPETVSNLTEAFIRGAQEYPILTTAKHFPGHGDTATDSHLDLPVLPHSDSRLIEIELPSFEKAIAAGVNSIMTAHLLIPAWDAERPATLSQPILTGKLRQELGFEGLIVTDALIMGGVTKYASPEEIAIVAVEAGADILLMPGDPLVAIETIERAVQLGRLSKERIHQSLERIWQAKKKVIQTSPLSLSFLDRLAQPQAMATTESILRDSLQTGGKLPLQPTKDRELCNLIVVDDILNCNFLARHTPAVTIPQELGYQLHLVDQNTLAHTPFDLRQTLLQIFIRGNPFRGTAGLTPKAKEIYQQLIQAKQVQGLIIYGSPYVLEWFITQIPENCPWVFTYGQMANAQALANNVLFGLPVDFPSLLKTDKPNRDNLDFGF
ncbi:beta-glucosidase [Pleurocapsales cyanobacterium LEGE 06147]|nr:beta-glucosidase [Pleurocapsales cyanobacterium LEGE 06147]